MDVAVGGREGDPGGGEGGEAAVCREGDVILRVDTHGDEGGRHIIPPPMITHCQCINGQRTDGLTVGPRD